MTEEKFLQTVSDINNCLSDYVLTILLVGVGIFFTFKTRFVQIRCFAEGWKNAFGRFSLHGDQKKTGMSPFQALTAAVAAQVGTGNIVGASGAILTGGPGAIFWMWIIAFFGMATIYAEAVLAQTTRLTEKDGTHKGGPVYYIKKAFPNSFGTFLAGFFAFAIIISLGFMGCMVQANSIGETCQTAFGIPAYLVGIFIAATAGLVFTGGVGRLVQVTEKLVPVMAILYLAGGLYVLITRFQYLPDTFTLIIKFAFTPEALIGGGIGHALKTAISLGVKRGLFSNEAGMGSTPHAHAIADVPSPHVQGTVAMMGVFIDTIIVLTMTALIVISTLYTGDGPLAGANASTYTAILKNTGLTQTNLVQYAIGSASTVSIGNIFVAVCLLFFAFSTILSWNYFGRINFAYLTGNRGILIYSFIAVLCIFGGTIMKSDLVWALQDMFNQLMVLPNALALLVLSGIVAKIAGMKKE
ncbi:MAG: sodium:alanine symporter family protein [Lentisphaeria bacterium]|nr:sodium:alanine symporter family protein [Lentisphaeria bacterium]